MEHEIFALATGIRVVICKSCKYGVRRKNVAGHLRYSHGLKNAVAMEVENAVKQWEGVDEEAESGKIPVVLEDKVDGLPMHDDGLQCRKVPECKYVCRSLPTMKEHWRSEHGWAVQQRIGGTRTSERAKQKKEMNEAMEERVSYQQVFQVKEGSHFIRILNPNPDEVNALPGALAQVDILVEEAKDKWLHMKELQEGIVEEADKYTANPWLRRTGWSECHGSSSARRHSIFVHCYCC